MEAHPLNIIPMTKPHGLTARECAAAYSFAARHGLGSETGQTDGGGLFVTLSFAGVGLADGLGVMVVAREARRVVVLDSAGHAMIDRADFTTALAAIVALLPGCPRVGTA